MTKEDIIHFAKECSSAVYELCLNNPFFNTTECPIGANGLSDVVLNAVLNAFPKTQELASIQQPQGLDEAPKRKLRKVSNLREDLKADKPIEERVEELRQIRAEKDRIDEAAEDWKFIHEYAPPSGNHPFIDAFKAGAKWMADRFDEDAYEEEVQELYADSEGIHYIVPIGTDYKPGDKVIVQIRKK